MIRFTRRRFIIVLTLRACWSARRPSARRPRSNRASRLTRSAFLNWSTTAQTENGVDWRFAEPIARWRRGRGIYLNVPDWYFLAGSSKTGMGYRESNWSLPREQQEIIERQNIFDGTWDKAP